MTHAQRGGGLTLVEKIATRHALGLSEGGAARSGDTVSVRPAHVLTHDNTGAVIPKFRAIGAARCADPRQPVFALDHNVQDTGEANRAKYGKIEAFAREMGVDFYPAGRGIGHQIMCEEGYAWPGTLVVASDSHANTYGGLGCLGTPVVRTDAAALWATGRTWWRVPPVARVVLTGRLRPGVTGKDVILALCARFKDDEVLNHAVEFAGGGVAALSMADRFTMANMTTEWGALAGLFPVDEVTLAWLEARIAFVERRGPAGVPSDADGGGKHPRLNRERFEALAADPPAADPDARYALEITLDLGSVVPWVAGPHQVKVGGPAAEMGGIEIRKAYLLSCVNGRVEDFAAAAEVLRGKKVAPGVAFYIAAASSEVQAESERRGDWRVLREAGAKVLPPGCGPCIGLGEGLLEPGERGISATNRNFKGRMGSRDAEAYLASPAVVAASAAAGRITDPFGYAPGELRASLDRPAGGAPPAGEVTIVEGFPAVLEGELLFCPRDNLNTDGIYPGKYTYIDDFTPEQQASVVMENYDPAFRDKARAGDILVGGFNFGTGSSREQAATALLHKGIRLVLAGSFSETYKRNAVNNGFLAVEAPELVRHLKERFGGEELTQRTGLEARVDFRAARVTVGGETFPIAPVGPAAQEIIAAGGLGPWVGRLLSGGDG